MKWYHAPFTQFSEKGTGPQPDPAGSVSTTNSPEDNHPSHTCKSDAWRPLRDWEQRSLSTVPDQQHRSMTTGLPSPFLLMRTLVSTDLPPQVAEVWLPLWPSSLYMKAARRKGTTSANHQCPRRGREGSNQEKEPMG